MNEVIVERVICLNKGEPSSKAKYGFISDRKKGPWGAVFNSNFISSLSNI
jgi:hypothetical protein